MKPIRRILLCQDKRIRTLDEVASFAELADVRLDSELRNKVRESVNRDLALIHMLRDAGNQVWLFDGYDDDLITKLKDPADGAKKLDEVVRAQGIQDMIYDLHYFTNFDYGMDMLSHLKSLGTLHRVERKIVVSWFVGENNFRDRLVHEYGFAEEDIHYGLVVPLEAIVNIMG